MPDKPIKYIIPAALVMMSAAITILLWGTPAHFKSLLKSILGSNTSDNTEILSLIILVGVTNYGLGYFCHVLSVFLVFSSDTIRFAGEKDYLFNLFNINPHICEKCKSKQRKELLDRFHYILHSSQQNDEGLHAFFSRRISGWYLIYACAFAVLVGTFLGVIFITKNPNLKFNNICNLPYFIGWGIFVIDFAIISYGTGKKWNEEFLGAARKFVDKNKSNFPAP